MQAILVHNVEGEDLEALNFSKACIWARQMEVQD